MPLPRGRAWQGERRTQSGYYQYFIDPGREKISTYSSILGLLGVAALERNAVALVLETLWGNQALDLWCLGVWLLALTLWLNLAADDELANLVEEFPLAGILTLCTVCTDRR